MNNESKGEKTCKYNGRVYHNIATVKESKNDKSLGQRMKWQITAEENVNFKRSQFFVTKVTCQRTHLCNMRSHAGIRGSQSFDRIMLVKTRSWSRWLTHKIGN